MTSSKAKGDPQDSWKPYPQVSPGNQNAHQQSQHNKLPNEYPIAHKRKWNPSPPSSELYLKRWCFLNEHQNFLRHVKENNSENISMSCHQRTPGPHSGPHDPQVPLISAALDHANGFKYSLCDS